MSPALLWLIPALPLLAAGIGALTPRGGRSLSAGAAIGAMGGAFFGIALFRFRKTISQMA